VIRLTGYGVIAEKPRVGQLGPIFPCTLEEKLYVGSKNDALDELYHRAKFGEDRTTRAGCRCENVVFVTMFVCLLPAGCHGNLTVLNLLRTSLTKNQHFRPCRKNCALDPIMIESFRIVTTFSISMQSLGEIELRAPAVGAKIGVFLYVTLCLPARGGHSSNKYCVTVYGSILMPFSAIFSEGVALSGALYGSHLRR